MLETHANRAGAPLETVERLIMPPFGRSTLAFAAFVRRRILIGECVSTSILVQPRSLLRFSPPLSLGMKTYAVDLLVTPKTRFVLLPQAAGFIFLSGHVRVCSTLRERGSRSDGGWGQSHPVCTA